MAFVKSLNRMGRITNPQDEGCPRARSAGDASARVSAHVKDGKPHVLFVTNDRWRDAIGGADRSLLNLVDALNDSAIPMEAVVSLDGILTRELRARGVRCHVFPYRNAMTGKGPGRSPISRLVRLLVRLRRSAGSTLAAIRLWKIAKVSGSSIIYSNSLVVDIGFRAARIAGIPHIWHVREHPEAQWGTEPVVGWALYRKWLGCSAAVISISEFISREVIGTGSENVVVIYNGVGTNRFLQGLAEQRTRERDVEGDFRFGMVGAVCGFKGQHQAVRALARLRADCPRARIVIAGDGQLDSLKRLIVQLKLEDAVRLLGRVDSCWPVWTSVDAGLMCSLCEPMGRVTVEAMAAGLPVIGRKSGATPELVEDGVTGLLYDGSIEDLAAKMKMLVELPDRGRKMGQSSALVAQGRFTTERYGASVLAKIEEVDLVSRQRSQRSC